MEQGAKSDSVSTELLQATTSAIDETMNKDGPKESGGAFYGNVRGSHLQNLATQE